MRKASSPALSLANFGHPPEVLNFWRGLIRPLLGRQPTPFFVFSSVPLKAALEELDRCFGRLPVRHWLSCKTQPLRPLVQWWQQQGRPIEVVSEFEFLAALETGFAPEQILVNGPAKHHWLTRHPVRGLRVNFDSVVEARALMLLPKRLGWTVGVRLNTTEEFDPEAPEFPTQFGLTMAEARKVRQLSQQVGIVLEMVHFHLRTNVASPAVYERALSQVAGMCREAGLKPRIVDCGGGFPPPHVLTRDSTRVDADFKLGDMARVYEQALKRCPGAQEIWLENGRWFSARSGALVVKILDTKERRGMRNLICDGGRTTHALVSTWEQHELLALPQRSGSRCLTTVNGPTCMAFDQLARRPMSRRLRPGDHLIWLEAGAYHLPWETRFSHGLAAVFWHDGKRTVLAREREPFARWWTQWKSRRPR